MDADGGNVTRLTYGLVADSPVFSPNGKQILFTTFDGPPRIWVMNADGTGQVALTDILNAEMSWSPNGKQIAFISLRDGTFEVYIMDADGGNQTRLTTDENEDHGPVVFSPNGKEIAFASDRGGPWDIYALSLQTGEQRQLTTNASFDAFPEWTKGSRNKM
jgi:Tol biopolymer transport system component